MGWRSEPRARDRAILLIRLATVGGTAGAIALSWIFSNLAEAYFSGKPAPTPAPPEVPAAAAPVQAPPSVVTDVVHHAYQGPAAAPSQVLAPRAPVRAPAAAPAPPPPPACHSTPSHPC